MLLATIVRHDQEKNQERDDKKIQKAVEDFLEKNKEVDFSDVENSLNNYDPIQVRQALWLMNGLGKVEFIPASPFKVRLRASGNE